MPVWSKQYKLKQYFPLVVLIYVMLYEASYSFWIIDKYFSSISSMVVVFVWLIINYMIGYLVFVELGSRITKIVKKDLSDFVFIFVIIYLILLIIPLTI